MTLCWKLSPPSLLHGGQRSQPHVLHGRRVPSHPPSPPPALWQPPTLFAPPPQAHHVLSQHRSAPIWCGNHLRVTELLFFLGGGGGTIRTPPQSASLHSIGAPNPTSPPRPPLGAVCPKESGDGMGKTLQKAAGGRGGTQFSFSPPHPRAMPAPLPISGARRALRPQPGLLQLAPCILCRCVGAALLPFGALRGTAAADQTPPLYIPPPPTNGSWTAFPLPQIPHFAVDPIRIHRAGGSYGRSVWFAAGFRLFFLPFFWPEISINAEKQRNKYEKQQKPTRHGPMFSHGAAAWPQPLSSALIGR